MSPAATTDKKVAAAIIHRVDSHSKEVIHADLGTPSFLKERGQPLLMNWCLKLES
jgi:hypothetical protein